MVLTFALAACGGDSGDGGGTTKTATDGKITIDAQDIHFDVDTIKAEPGELEITLQEAGALVHTFKILDTDFELKVDADTKTDTGTIELEKGTYEFECTIPGHAGQGMKGEIVVG
jgi:plastocyanin